MKETILLEKTKRGHPALWEKGGAYSRHGYARIIAGTQGEALVPLYEVLHGHLACRQHALFPIRTGYIIVEVGFGGGEEWGWVVRVTEIAQNSDGDLEATIETVSEWDPAEGWVPEIPENLRAAAEAAWRKSRCYHCRESHYHK